MRIGPIVLFGLLVSMSFNSCSKVKFQKVQADLSSKTPDGPNKENGENEVDCSVQACPGYTDKIIVPYKSNKIDIVLVIDNSASMIQENAEMAQRLNGMVQTLESAGASWQMCYTTTHVAFNDKAGKMGLWKTKASGSVKSTGSYVLAGNSSSSEEIFKTTMKNIELGSGTDGSGAEQGIAALRIAIDRSDNSSCFRSKAALAVILLSDEDELSCGGRCQTSSDEPDLNHWSDNYYKNAFGEFSDYNKYKSLIQRVSSKWPSKAFTAHAIVIREGDRSCWSLQDAYAPAFYGVQYAKLQNATGGILGNICASSYASQLQNVATRSLKSLESVSLKCIPESSPKVSFDPSPGSVDISRSGNKLFFEPGIPSGTTITVNYQCAL